MSFCVSQETPPRVWMQPQAGQNFEPMAQFCCVDIPKILAAWRKESQGPAADRWYLIQIDDLRPDVAAQLIQEKEAAGSNPDVAVEAEEQTSEFVSSDISTPETTPNHDPGTNFDWDLIIYGFLSLLTLAGIPIAVALFLSMRNSTRTLGDLPPTRNLVANNHGAEGLATEVQYEHVKQLAPILAAALAQTLETTLKNMEGKQITIELVPPLSKTTDWVSFLRAVRQELDRSTIPTGSDLERGHQKPDRSEEATGTPPPPIVSRVGGGRQLYASRATYYGDGSNNFGGRPVFTESSDRTAAFCIRVDERGSGWLMPNFDAREFDPLYHQIFGLSRNDFLNKTPARPQQVRIESGQWVLVAQR